MFAFVLLSCRPSGAPGRERYKPLSYLCKRRAHILSCKGGKCALDERLQWGIGWALLVSQEFSADFRCIRSKSLQAKAQGVLNPEIASGANADFPIEIVRATFPALRRTPEFIFFDNA